MLERVRVTLLDIPVELQAYAHILATLGAGGYRDESLGLGGEVDYGGEHRGPGDGTVLRSSALLDERRGGAFQPMLRSPVRFTTTLFLPEDHLGLTSSPVLRDNVLLWLLEQPR